MLYDILIGTAPYSTAFICAMVVTLVVLAATIDEKIRKSSVRKD